MPSRREKIEAMLAAFALQQAAAYRRVVQAVSAAVAPEEVDPQEPPPVLRGGWWRDPFRIGRNEQRYHDGAQWTRFTSRKVDGVWSGIVERSPSYYRGRINGEERPEARFLPEPKSVPLDPPEPPSVGWWVDPFRSYGHQVQRYYDGRAWTLYPRKLSLY